MIGAPSQGPEILLDAPGLASCYAAAAGGKQTNAGFNALASRATDDNSGDSTEQGDADDDVAGGAAVEADEDAEPES